MSATMALHLGEITEQRNSGLRESRISCLSAFDWLIVGLGDEVSSSIVIPLGIVWFHVGCPCLNCITMSYWIVDHCDMI